MKIKSKNLKRSQEGIIAIILIILLCLVALYILWKVILPMSQNANEETQIRDELMKTRIGVNDVSGNLLLPIDNKLDITLSRGSGKLNFLNQTNKNYTNNRTISKTVLKLVNHTINVTKTINVTHVENVTLNYLNNISIVSALDISNSMSDDSIGECQINKSTACCSSNNCLTSTGCAACNGRYIGNECYLYSLDNCCKFKDCYDKIDCESCGGIYDPNMIPYDLDTCSIKSCSDNKSYCLNNCKGVWRSKLNTTQEANNILIDNIFNKNPDNDMGALGFAGTVLLSDCEPPGCNTLTKDKNILKNKVNSYTVYLGTNGCQGLNKSINMLKSSKNDLKFIILMSDGYINILCDGTWGNYPDYTVPKQQAVDQAVIANNLKIKIYTIGLGKNTDFDTLQKIATITNGTYSYANISSLSAVYNTIINTINVSMNVTKLENMSELENITVLENVTEYVNETINETITETYYEPVQIWQSLRIVVYNTSSSFIYNNITGDDVLDPLETRTYPIPSGGLTNINKIEIYLIAHLENGKEISDLVAVWTPGSEESSNYIP